MKFAPSPEARKAIGDLSKISPLRSLATIGIQWAVICICIITAAKANYWVVSLGAAFVIATRQHAIGILMHDAAHVRLFRSRALNDFVSDMLLAFPLGLSTRLYREHHLQHHSQVNTPADPDWKQMQVDKRNWGFPKFYREGLVIFFRDLTGMNACAWLNTLGQRSPLRRRVTRPKDRFCFLAWWICLASVLHLIGGWKPFLVFWILPLLTITSLIFRVRGLAEHVGVEDRNELSSARVVLPAFWERILICPCHVNFHLEHHLYPSVPFFNLPELHRVLMEEEEFRSEAHVCHGYFSRRSGVLRELLRRNNYSEEQVDERQ